LPWKPPCHEPAWLYVAVQPPAVPVRVGMLRGPAVRAIVGGVARIGVTVTGDDDISG